MHTAPPFQHDAAKRLFTELAELLPWPSPSYAALVACAHAAWLPFMPAEFIESTPSAPVDDSAPRGPPALKPDVAFMASLVPWARRVHTSGTLAQQTLLEELGLVAVAPGEELWVRALHTPDEVTFDDDDMHDEPAAFLPVLAYPPLSEAIVLLERAARQHASTTVARTGFEFAVRTLRWARVHVGDELFGAFVHDVTPSTSWTLLGRTHAGDA